MKSIGIVVSRFTESSSAVRLMVSRQMARDDIQEATLEMV
jgi:hypothetical protein